jgi:hypothetical protein
MQNKIDSMKNVFFSLAFMLIGSFAFANTEVTSDIDINKIESLINVDNLDLPSKESEALVCGFTVNFDDGTGGDPYGPWGGSGSFYYSNDDCTWDDIFDMFDLVLPGWTSAIIRF